MDMNRRSAAGPIDEQEPTASLAVGCFASICRDQLGDLLIKFANRWPGVDLGIHDMGRGDLLAGVRDGTLALAVLPGGAESGLQSLGLLTDRVMVSMASSHRLASLTQVPVRELIRERMLVPRGRQEGELYRFLARRAAPLTRLNDTLCEVGRPRLLDEVAVGAALALTCDSHCEPDGHATVRRPIAGAAATFTVNAYWRAPEPRWPLSALIEDLSAIFA